MTTQRMENRRGQADPAAAVCSTGGYCRRCGREHRLAPGNTPAYCRELMHRLERLGTIDLLNTRRTAGLPLATDPLFGLERGKMFGVLECLQPDGATVILYAFSGQYRGVCLVDGWVPPLFAVDDFLALTADTERRIKRLGREIDGCPPHSSLWLAKRKERRQLSRSLMHDIHGIYRLTNFRGEMATLGQAFTGAGGIPTGTGDCCAPKLLNFAAQNRLLPLGISEFFWGRENLSGEHRHGCFTSSCQDKCWPILGFLLCGLDDQSSTEGCDEPAG